MQGNPLIGIWRLVSWVLVDSEGKKNFPYGEDAQGSLIYTPQGLMSVHVMCARRNHFRSYSVFNASLEEAASSYKTYVSYCGTYEITGDKIFHYVEMHTCPNWIGTVQERLFHLDGDLLHLIHPLEQRESQVLWQKRS